MSERKKTATICMRLAAETKLALEQRANERNLTITDFLTRAGLGRATRQRTDVDAINLLRDCASELRSIHATLLTLRNDADVLIDPMRMDTQMAAITSAITRVWTDAGENHE